MPNHLFGQNLTASALLGKTVLPSTFLGVPRTPYRRAVFKPLNEKSGRSPFVLGRGKECTGFPF